MMSHTPLNADDELFQVFDNYNWDGKIGTNAEEEIKHSIREYIFADRKKHELQARIDELNSVEEDPWGVQHIPKPREYRNGYTVGVMSIEERIAQLQAELKEVSKDE